MPAHAAEGAGRAAERRMATPLEAFIAMAGAVIAAQDEDEAALRPFAARALRLLEAEGLRRPAALLDDHGREVVLRVGERFGVDGIARDAFARLPPIEPSGIPTVRLSERELQVLRALAEHASRAEVAARLFLSENTVKSHLASLHRKLGVGDREGLLLEAIGLGLLDPRG